MRFRRREGTRLLALRFSGVLAWWLQESAARAGGSRNAFIRQLLDDARTCFGLPRPVVERLEQDAAALGLDRRRYTQHVLYRRYQEVEQSGAGFDCGRSLGGGSASEAGG